MKIIFDQGIEAGKYREHTGQGGEMVVFENTKSVWIKPQDKHEFQRNSCRFS